ncbi:MAG: hypothetical protein ACK5RG_18330 [Cyclobacteriaceae bacterium]|jgi:hypothetical protein|nr:hypothetical protein [Flammeovirgaceae bacterium]
MAKDHYLPRTDEGKLIWINNFSAKIGNYVNTVGLTAADVTSAKNDAAMFAYLVNAAEVFTTAKEQRVNFKNLIKDGPLGKPLGLVPDTPVLGTKPADVAPGIFPRLAQLVQRIKNSAAYTEAIGKDLGIIGAKLVVDFDALKPKLKLVMKGGQVEVQWTRGDADAVYIEVDRGNGTWQFLAVDTVPHYTDTMPITTHAMWKYRAIYLIRDERVGHWSDVNNIAVG